MDELSSKINKNPKVMYAFRFNACNKCVRLSEEKLDRIPYLSALVAHKNDFLSTQNKNGEYVLNPPFYYNWFMTILHTISSEQPYTLFTELPEDNNILGVLQLFDYLALHSFDLPLLENKFLVLLNPATDDNEDQDAKYHRANLSEARNTAAEFAIAISKNEYDLSDPDTANDILLLITIILSKTDVFSSRFRHHTLTIAKECCFQFFTKNQQNILINNHQKNQKHRKLNSLMYLYNDENSLPDDFENVFAWKGVSTLPIQMDNNRSLLSFREREYIIHMCLYNIPDLSHIQHSAFYFRLLYRDRHRLWEKVELERMKNEAFLSARSKHFNTLPKRSYIDKFKHRSEPKAQKHR